MRLQWGRDPSVTETDASIQGGATDTCFNGAVTLQSRKPATVDPRRSEYHGFNGAVTLQSRKPDPGV